MMRYSSGWAWWQIGSMWVAVIAFVVLLIWTGYVLISNTGRPERPGRAHSGGPVSPQRVLSERLARGEIDAAEYGRLRGLLDGGTPTLER